MASNIRYRASACTDVTGFGLLGHLIEMVKPAGVDVTLDLQAIPLLQGAQETVAMGITMGSPQNYKFEFCLWTLNIICSMIAKERGVKLSKSAVSRLLGHLGLSPQRPLYKSYKQNPKDIEQYLNKTFPEVVEQARELGAEIYFVDEAAVRSDSHRGWTWGKVGKPPVVQDSGGRFGLNVISAVTPRGDMRFSFIEKRMNSARFIAFLKKLRQDAGRPIIVITDNARYHRSKETQRFLDTQPESILMAFLPAHPSSIPMNRSGTMSRRGYRNDRLSAKRT